MPEFRVLYCRKPCGGILAFFNLASSTSVGGFKTLVSRTLGIAESSLRLSSSGVPLDDYSSTLESLPSSDVDIDVRLRGGKTHGRLNQAGKVKNMTPKVDPQPKKKPKTGRARKRQQYNKRFNVQISPDGRPYGPNSNR